MHLLTDMALFPHGGAPVPLHHDKYRHYIGGRHRSSLPRQSPVGWGSRFTGAVLVYLQEISASTVHREAAADAVNFMTQITRTGTQVSRSRRAIRSAWLARLAVPPGRICSLASAGTALASTPSSYLRTRPRSQPWDHEQRRSLILQWLKLRG
jgi:hypothetical protein